MFFSINDVEQRAITTLDQIKAMERYPDLQQALKLSELLQTPVSIMHCQRLLMLVCERLYDFKQALEHSQSHNELRKKLFAKKALYGLKSMELFYGASVTHSDQLSG